MNCVRNGLTAERLRELLNYDHETGRFTRKADAKKGKAKAGDPFGSLSKSTGYREGWVDGVKYLEHRLVWLYVTGEWPSGQVDHINHVRDCNVFANLRDATNGQNQMNLASAKSHNKTGLLGVSANKKGFKAEIRANGRRMHIGTYPTPEQASAAYQNAKKKLHGWLYE
jgi:hypothetical protein